jgi:hypothetical protein
MLLKRPNSHSIRSSTSRHPYIDVWLVVLLKHELLVVIKVTINIMLGVMIGVEVSAILVDVLSSSIILIGHWQRGHVCVVSLKHLALARHHYLIAAVVHHRIVMALPCHHLRLVVFTIMRR